MNYDAKVPSHFIIIEKILNHFRTLRWQQHRGWLDTVLCVRAPDFKYRDNLSTSGCRMIIDRSINAYSVFCLKHR